MRVPKYYVKINCSDIVRFYKLCNDIIKTMKKLSPIMWNLQTYCYFKLDIQNMDQNAGGKWLIHGTRHRKYNQLQSLEHPIIYPSRESKHDIKDSECNMCNPIFKENIQGRKHPMRCAFAEPELLSYRKPGCVIKINRMTTEHNNNDWNWTLSRN